MQDEKFKIYKGNVVEKSGVIQMDFHMQGQNYDP